MDAVVDPPLVPGHVKLVDKVRVVAASAVAAALMATLGWFVAAPWDTQLALSITQNSLSLMRVWPAMVIISAATAAVATAIAGRRLPEAGLFATGIGLGMLALRGGSMKMVLDYHAANDPAVRRSLMFALGLDVVMWTSVIAAAWLTAILVRGWLWSQPAVATANTPAQPDAQRSNFANQGWLAMIITTVVAAFVVWQTIARTPVAEIARGQVIASVAGGLFLGALAARSFTEVADARWYVFAAAAIGIVAYLLGYLNADLSWAEDTQYQFYADLSSTPPHALVRALPVEYLSVGVAGAIGGFWSGEKVHQAVEEG
jgi:hypothetical protein